MPTVVREGTGGDNSLALGVLPAQVRGWDISLQPWEEVPKEVHLEGEPGLATLPPGMRMERGPHLPGPLTVPRAVLCCYTLATLRPEHRQDADAGTFPLGPHGKMRDVCWARCWKQTSERWPHSCRDTEQTALSLHACRERMLTRHLSHPFLQFQGSVTFRWCGSSALQLLLGAASPLIYSRFLLQSAVATLSLIFGELVRA